MGSIVRGGMDVHQEEIRVALITSVWSGSEEAREEGGFVPGKIVHEETIANRPDKIRKALKRLERKFGRLVMCYEASGCGYVLQRCLGEMGIDCRVVAPSKIPKAPGDRVKTDRRDARKLAKLFWANQLTYVRVPKEAEEAVRDLVRCRDAFRKDVMRDRHRVLKLLQRKGRVYREGKNWTQKHRRWLKKLEFEGPEKLVYEKYVADLEWKESQIEDLDREIEKVAFSEAYREDVEKMRCLRGIDTLSAMTLMTEVIDFSRFPSAPALMDYLGLVPSENSSGGKVRRGSITKAGNTRARRILTEAAWHYRHKPALGKGLKERQEGQPEWVKAHSWKGQHRLHKKFHGIRERGHPAQVAVVAVARELAGFIWAIMQPEDPGIPPSEFSEVWANALDDGKRNDGGKSESSFPPTSSVANAPGYSWTGCSPAEPASASPGG